MIFGLLRYIEATSRLEKTETEAETQWIGLPRGLSTFARLLQSDCDL